jgi:CheY-like chemotaxis protein/anti-sigma regulatory factor (Ser/Thr protein kinase)
LHKIVKQTIDLLYIKAREKNNQLLYSISLDTPNDLKGDPVRIQQILFNLIGNAIKFTNSGEINVNIFATQKTNPVIIKFIIKDTGIGISKDIIDKLFKPFTQADQSITRKYGGTGLGLSITKQLVHMMDGEIQVKSQLDVGSVFIFTLRLESSQSSELTKQDTEPQMVNNTNDQNSTLSENIQQSNSNVSNISEPEIDLLKKKNLHVLFVEDMKVNQRIATIFLNKLNCVIDYANNGAEAIEKLTQKKYDFVLMDVMMPIMDGLTATKTIRDPQSSVLDHSIPIIAMTANVMEGDREKCLDAGMNDYLPKPVKFKSLATKLYQNIVV